MRRFAFLLFAGAALLASPAHATWPERTVTFIVPASAGTALDAAARIVAERLTRIWGQPVIIENKVGAGGTLGTEYTRRLPPDGYSLLFAAPTHYISKYLYASATFDPVADFEPVARTGVAHMVLLVKADSKYRSLGDIIDAAKAHPDQLTYSSAGVGTFSHLAAVMLENLAGIKLRHIPYKDAGLAVTDVLGGRIDLTFTAVTTAAGQVGPDMARPIATSGEKRSRTMPDVPTLAESGIPKYAILSWNEIVAAKGVPDTILEKVSKDVGEVLSNDDTITRLEKAGVEVNYIPWQELRKSAPAENEKWHQLVIDSGAQQQ
ncbi:Bug family tripartite tricarboxylate transporter substrate binding protein [Bradyrhizobium sp. McL0615]|uniref:Bug family tripartite tricarboxylate transporter substrate binding protein n=1 Tax=Bradyrhizobium sp. McL0615 TaxID=3415673 RepID=UPI003CED95DF